MKRANNKALYEKIMRNVSREIKKALNESNDASKTIPFDRITRKDYVEDDPDHIYCECNIDYHAVFSSPKFRKLVKDYIDMDMFKQYLAELENDKEQRLKPLVMDYYYNGGGYSEFGYEIPEYDFIDDDGFYDTLDESLFDYLHSYEPSHR